MYVNVCMFVVFVFVFWGGVILLVCIYVYVRVFSFVSGCFMLLVCVWHSWVVLLWCAFGCLMRIVCLMADCLFGCFVCLLGFKCRVYGLIELIEFRACRV